MFLLDTNVISEMRKLRSGRIDANVARWSKAANARDLHIATITPLAPWERCDAGSSTLERSNLGVKDVKRTRRAVAGVHVKRHFKTNLMYPKPKKVWNQSK